MFTKVGTIRRKIGTALTWKRREWAFQEFLSRNGDLLSARGAGSGEDNIAIIIQPWHGTPMPWYLITLALMLKKRGRGVKVIWDDTSFSPNQGLLRVSQNSISNILGRLGNSVPWSRLSEYLPSETLKVSAQELERYARINAIVQFRGETPSAEADRYVAASTKAIERTALHLQEFYRTEKPSYVLVNGGAFGSTRAVVHIGQQAGCRVATIDAGEGVVLVSTDGIAANLEDIPRAFHQMPPSEYTIGEARAEMQRRSQGKDIFRYQTVKSTGVIGDVGVLMPLNQSFDTSALGRHFIYKDQTDWILQTAKWVLENTKETVTIRRHPIERRQGLLSNDDYEGALKNLFGDNERIRYIAESDEVSTYDLLDRARVVVPYISSVGIEAAALGKPVVTEGANCYADLGFAWSARTEERYFKLLGQALNGELQVTPEQQDGAWHCYYLTQCCNFCLTDFTPLPRDYEKWVQRDAKNLLETEQVQSILEAIDGNEPIACIQHRKRMEKASKESTSAGEYAGQRQAG